MKKQNNTLVSLSTRKSDAELHIIFSGWNGARLWLGECFNQPQQRLYNLPAVVIMVKIMRQTSFSRRPLNTYGFGLQTICLKKNVWFEFIKLMTCNTITCIKKLSFIRKKKCNYFSVYFLIFSTRYLGYV